MNESLVTAESVTEGHPDKVCDQISDGILDAYLTLDKDAHVAVESMISKNVLLIAGEVTSTAKVDITKTAKDILKGIGYDDISKGFNCDKCLILTNINHQSPDIARGVCQKNEIGAGDQGIMYGYACDETQNFMPLPVDLANKLSMRLAEVRKNNILPWLYPDGKTQVTMKYDEHGNPQKITSIIVSAQHKEMDLSHESIYENILNEVIYCVVEQKWLDIYTQIHINPTGRFVIGGPAGDTGLTGRKIMVDTYGGIGKHGGGAFSGKDSTKVDRSGAYMARYVAKNIVAAGLAKKCEVSLAYAIGLKEPEAVNINTFGTECIDLDILNSIVNKTFSFSVSSILKQLDLNKPQFLKTAAYGHFGRENQNFKWEETDKKKELQTLALKAIIQKFHKN